MLDLLNVGHLCRRSAVSVPAILVLEEEPVASAESCSGETRRSTVTVRSPLTSCHTLLMKVREFETLTGILAAVWLSHWSRTRTRSAGSMWWEVFSSQTSSNDSAETWIKTRC